MNYNFLRILTAVIATTLIDRVRSNERFDPFDALVNTLVENITCTLPPYQSASHQETYLPPPEGACPVDNGAVALSADELQDLAIAYAPVLLFHPLEQYTLQSVRELFRDPTLGNIQEQTEGLAGTQLWDATLNLTSLLLSTRDPDVGLHSSRFFLQRQLWESQNNATSFLYGAGFNASGYSNAVIYYNSYP
jgi:hypothetical protein